jgi:hypothetical protein
MGLFLAMSGVIGAGPDAVESSLRSFAVARKGSFCQEARTMDDPDTLVLLKENSTCSILYPEGFFDWDEASQYLSAQLGVPVFSLHIHDGDLWMFILFDKGVPVTQFNPQPEYWDGSISKADRAAWAGDAAQIAACLPGTQPETLAPYLRHWDFNEEDPGKAFPDDQYHYYDCWQMCDFLRRVGLRYPLDESGEPLGGTYEFAIPEKR